MQPLGCVTCGAAIRPRLATGSRMPPLGRMRLGENTTRIMQVILPRITCQVQVNSIGSSPLSEDGGNHLCSFARATNAANAADF